MKKLRLKLARWIAPRGYDISPAIKFDIDLGSSMPESWDGTYYNQELTPSQLFAKLRAEHKEAAGGEE